MRLPGLRRKGHAFYYDAGGKPRRWIALGSNEAVALRRYRELRGGETSAADSIDQMLADYARSLVGSKLTRSTLRQYGYFEASLSRWIGDQPAGSINQADIARYLEECPRTSARGEVSFLSGAYRRWMKLGKLDFNPCIGARCDKPRSKRDRLLSVAELHAVIAAAKRPVFGLAVELAYATGLRLSDLLALRWDNFGEEGESPILTRKTGARIVYAVDDGLRDILERCRALQAHVVSLHVLAVRGRALKPRTVERWWREACLAAGIADAQWRDIRAAAGTEVDRLGGDATAFLGHRDRRTTRIYLRGKQVITVKPLRLVK